MPITNPTQPERDNHDLAQCCDISQDRSAVRSTDVNHECDCDDCDCPNCCPGCC
jgi:hypothetical protein